MDYQPEVARVVAGGDYTVYAYFTDGSVRLFDVKPFMVKGGVFAYLADEVFFNERLTVMHGTVAWDITGDGNEERCLDLDPLTIYENATVVPDPFEGRV